MPPHAAAAVEVAHLPPLDTQVPEPEGVPDDLLAKLANYDPGAYDPTGVRRGLGLLRDSGLLDRLATATRMVVTSDARRHAAGAYAHQLGILRGVGRGSLPLGRIVEGHVNALELIARLGDEVQRTGWLQDAYAGEVFGVWNTEAGDGVHIRPLPKGGYELAGAKTFCSGARDVTRALITGQLWEGGRAVGWQMAIVDPRELAPDRTDDSFWEPLGMEASASHRVDFTGLRLPASALLGEPGDYHVEPYFSGGAVRFAAVQLGGAEALYDHVVALLRRMRRERDPYQVHRIARMALALRGGRHWLAGAPRQALPDRDGEDAVADYGNAARIAIGDACDVVLAEAERAVGARGFLEPEPVRRIYCDLKMYLRQPNPDGALAAVGHRAVETFNSPLGDDGR